MDTKAVAVAEAIFAHRTDRKAVEVATLNRKEEEILVTSNLQGRFFPLPISHAPSILPLHTVLEPPHMLP
jgi:hypothetical protein